MTTSPEYRNPLMEILSAATPEPRSHWDLTRERPDEYEEWQTQVYNGDTLLGFVGWLNARDEDDE